MDQAGGELHPAAAALVKVANKTLTIRETVKDALSAATAITQLAPVYAEMSGPPATLTAMTENERDVAKGSALPSFVSVGMGTASLMLPLSSDPALAEMVEDMLEDIPPRGARRWERRAPARRSLLSCELLIAAPMRRAQARGSLAVPATAECCRASSADC